MNMPKTVTSDADPIARIDADEDEPTGEPIEAASLRELAAAVDRRSEAEMDIQAAVDAAREDGLSWGVIGAVLGISRQGALRRYGH